MKSIFITHPAITLQAIRDAFSESGEKRIARRLLALELFLEGKSKKDINEFLKLGPNTLAVWIRAVSLGGLNGLAEKEGRGRKARLKDSEAESLKKDILKSPRSLGYTQSNWTGKLIIRHIGKRFGVNYRLSSSYVILENLGFTLQRPTRSCGETDAEAQRTFTEKFKKKDSK
jgi:transposase